ncbi:MAG: hypothetical protein A2Y00_04785 [Omnitrophica WOR_2 bacterium GWF2_43_52]|nr:MAG: hypothetical protein A2062_04995 [Omnitrophica WOR_2 bacterium GWA2_44_7]OGX15146.1 MAG: hypothetical protein A2Y01_03595 [Omnitrophica WOR_2 bacterium GWC2_44_8]OGX20423.1 MAG: hypothetical protein A2Y00_04785 [Omnitrophica WOR_2 bacterium GWF2_43_52]HAH20477.1 hypothetical protein [Candidatus Omnitrophota bacterium]HBG62978.1 hypothetical protein [Candidatus Omnitrophota bacterium]
MENYIGIDIGSRYTKIVALERKPAITLTAWLEFKTPYLSQAAASGNPLDIKIFWEETTKHIPQEKLRAAHIAVTLPSNAVSAMTLLLPRVAKNELTAIATTEAKRKMIPVSGPNHIFENFLVGSRITAKIPRYEVMVARSDISLVKHLLELFGYLHLEPELIGFSSSALFSLLPAQALADKNADTAFVDIGMLSINTSILREGKLSFFRNTAFGLNDIIKDLAKNLALSENRTEEVLLEKGIPEVDFDLKDKVALAEEIMRQKYEASVDTAGKNELEEINALELRSLWQAHIERMLHELRRSLMFYKEQSEGRRVEHICFLGGGAHIKNLIALLVKQLGGEWQIVYPFKNMQIHGTGIENHAQTPIFSNAAAIALSCGQKEIAVINFLPPNLKAKKTHAKKRLWFLIAAIVLVCSTATLSAIAFVHTLIYTKALATIETDLAIVRDVAETLKEFDRREKKITQDTMAIEAIHNQRIPFFLILASLAKSTPQAILLTHVTIAKGQAADMAQEAAENPDVSYGAIAETYRLSISAAVVSDYETALGLIKRFRGNLENIPYLKNITASDLQLEEISPQRNTQTGKVTGLTKSQTRIFSLNAQIAVPAQSQ